MLNDKNFMLYAAKHYDNSECHSIDEFKDDLSKLKYLKKIFKRYNETKEINIRLTLNYIITFYNLFGIEGSNAMLFFKLKEYLHILKPFLVMLNYMPNTVALNGSKTPSSDIILDQGIVDMLRKI